MEAQSSPFAPIQTPSAVPSPQHEVPVLEPWELGLGEKLAVAVLAVGNPIMGDDGAGVSLLAALQELITDPRVVYVDGGTAGMELLPLVQQAERLLILDAVAGQIPGTVIRLTGDQVPRLLSTKLSPHQVGLLDILSAARLLGQEPAELVVVGVVPEVVTMTYGLSPVVSAALGEAATTAAAVLTDWLADLPDQSLAGIAEAV